MIEVRGLSKRFDREEGTYALKDVSFQVEKGRILGVLGNEGAGKTTLLRILATLIHPTEGRVEVDGHSVVRDREAVKRLVGYAPHNPSFHRNMQAAKYLDFWARVDGLSRSQRRDRIQELVAFLDLAEEMEETVLDMSTSAQQRLFIAETLLADPPVLIVDEPFTSLDPEAAATLSERFRVLNKEGKTILLTASRLRDVQDLSDTAVVLEGGRATSAWRTRELLTAVGAARHARLFVSADRFPAQVLAALKEHPDVVHVRETEMALIVFVNPGKDISRDVHRVFEEAGVQVKHIKRAEIPLSDVFRSLAGRKAS